MPIIDDVRTYLRVDAKVSDFCADHPDRDLAERLEHLVSDAGEALGMDPDADVEQYAIDIAAILQR